MGWFGAKWEISGKTFTISVDTPEGTHGLVTIPLGSIKEVEVDGKKMKGDSSTFSIGGGNHKIVAS